ncbi:MAG TPA: aminodeoxychorismate synthase component I [Actinomycetota bacterium]|nr:aminodeoxychorismate synthase component I [Actinomycetota bacterium]
MIEARFDDLVAGAERSFRLAEPVGVIEARRPGELAGAIDAAGSAAARGLWAAGFVAYEAATGLDPELSVHVRSPDDPFAELPLAWFALFERKEDVPPLEPGRLEPPGSTDSPWRPSVDRATYDAAVERIRELIAAGHTYQVNHTIRLRAMIRGDERGFYRDLCLAQRGGYAAFLDLGRYRVLSASPELFFRIDGDRITTRPMKGTATRGRWQAEDERIAARLVSSSKDRAENAMIVDLLRNDLGRICRTGSVGVERMLEAERFETVWQLTSTIEGDLRPEITLLDTFRALFPSGSVTGAPKVRTTRIIADLEDSARGPYCGAIGYLSPPGSGEPRANFNVAIRTVVLDGQTRMAEYGVGGGITHDSSAPAEYEEIVAKARVLTDVRPAFELFESVAHAPAEGFRHLDEHLQRLAASARYFGFRFELEAAAAALKQAVVEVTGLSVVRLTLARDGALSTDVRDLPPAVERVRVAIDDEPVDPSDPWLFHKTTRRAPYDRRRERRPDVDDVLLVNDRGEVTESTVANLAVRLEGVWVTPPIDAGLLPGTYRTVLLRDGRLIERPVTVDELRGAGELALVSSVRGWRPAVLEP